MITGIIGLPGSGKSIYGALRARTLADKYTASRRLKHRKVLANFPVLRGGRQDQRIGHITTWDEVKDLTDCDVFIDEAPRWFPAREWSKYGKIEDMMVWAQARHDGVNLHWITQAPDMIDVQIREMLTTYIYRVDRLFGPDEDGFETRLEQLVGVRSIVKKYDAAAYYRASTRKALKRNIYDLRKLYGLHDTSYTVGDRLGAGARFGTGRMAAEAAEARAKQEQRTADYYDMCTNRDGVMGMSGYVAWQPPADLAIMAALRNKNDQNIDDGTNCRGSVGLDLGGGCGGRAQDASNGDMVGASNKSGSKLAVSLRAAPPTKKTYG